MQGAFTDRWWLYNENSSLSRREAEMLCWREIENSTMNLASRVKLPHTILIVVLGISFVHKLNDFFFIARHNK